MSKTPRLPSTQLQGCVVAEYAHATFCLPVSRENFTFGLILFLGKGSRGRPGDEARVLQVGCANAEPSLQQ